MTYSPPEDGVVFSQKSTNRSNYFNNDEYQKIATCHKCDKKGHIIPNFPNTNSDKYYHDESNNK